MIPEWADKEAWEAMRKARLRVRHVDPSSGAVQWLQEWQHRQAPSVGARARAIIRDLLFPPSYITACEEALALYLSDEQNADRRGFWKPRKSNAPQRLKGVQHYG